jgi:hypothetical protein
MNVINKYTLIKGAYFSFTITKLHDSTPNSISAALVSPVCMLVMVVLLIAGCERVLRHKGLKMCNFQMLSLRTKP